MSHPYFTPPVVHGYSTPHTTVMPFTSPISNEPATPTFVPETQLSNRESSIEVVNLEKAISNAEGSRKRSSWTKVEDEFLARGFVTISDDPIIGNDQKTDVFWRRVASYYNENRPPGSNTRSANVIRSHWHNPIQKKVYRFNANYNNVYSSYRSGHSDEDILRFAYEKYRSENNGVAFNLVLEAVTSHNLWIWHAFFGVVGSRNDINVLCESLIFNNVLQGNAPEINFTVNGTAYTNGYYLIDGIYPEWATFVKAFPCPEDPKRKLFKERQKSARKMSNGHLGCFNLDGRWSEVQLVIDIEKKLKQIMLACIILHNMIVEDDGGYVTNWYNDEGDEPAQPIHGSNRGFQDCLRTNSELRYTQVHHQLRADLVEHIWGQDNNP